jgi:hypothetical protein
VAYAIRDTPAIHGVHVIVASGWSPPGTARGRGRRARWRCGGQQRSAVRAFPGRRGVSAVVRVRADDPRVAGLPESDQDLAGAEAQVPPALREFEPTAAPNSRVAASESETAYTGWSSNGSTVPNPPVSDRAG